MSCHYSCASCSSPIFMFKCLSCATTRQLVDSTCICKSGYYQRQLTQCYPSQQADWLTFSVLPIANVLYYTNLAFFWLYAIIIFCRVNSPKFRILLNFGQIIALINYYPYVFEQISKQFLWSLSSLNFSYLFNLFTCTDSQICTLFQYIWEPLLVLPALLICFAISFFMIKLCYRNSLDESVSFGVYLSQNWFFVVYMFVDFTATILSYNITKSVLLNNLGFIFVGVYLIVIVLVCVKFFRIINTQQQSRIVYRYKFNWAYGYDQNYHLYFIDYLYSETRKPHHKIQENGQNNTFHTTISGAVFPQKQNRHAAQGEKINMFIPHSNLYILQLLLKLMVGCTTALLYEYKPAFIIFSLIVLINISVCLLGAFFYYDKFSLLLYILMSLITLVSAALYWMGIYWLVAIATALLATGFMGALLIVLFVINRKLNDKLVNKIFMDQAELNRQSKEKASEQQLIHFNNKNQAQSGQNYQIKSGNQNPMFQNSNTQQEKKIRQPFSGNLKKMSAPKNNARPQLTQNIIQAGIQQQDLLKTHSNNNTQKSKLIFKDLVKQEHGAQNQQKKNSIRPSNFQSKISDVRSKITARNRTKNAIQDINPIHEQSNTNNNNEQAKLEDQSSQNLISKNKYKTKYLGSQSKQPSINIRKIQSQLDDVLKQPSNALDNEK